MPVRLVVFASRRPLPLRDASGEELRRLVDIPFCRADLFYITKLAIALSVD